MKRTAMELTREVFGNIPEFSTILFYFLGGLATAIFAYGVYLHFRLWRVGRRTAIWSSSQRIISGLLREVLGQRRVIRRRFAGWAHFTLFWGFLILFIGTLLLMAEHVVVMLSKSLSFHHGLYYAVYEVILDTAGIALVVGCVLLAYRRWTRPPSLGHNWGDWVILTALFTTGVTGYVIEALRLLWAKTPLPALSYVGYGVALLIGDGVSEATLRSAHYWLWWFHGLVALAIVAAFPYVRLFHAIAGTLNITTEPAKLGTMRPVSLEEVEQTGRIGVGNLTDFGQGSLLQTDACMECSRCQDACPAYASGKPLSPRAVVQDVKELLKTTGPALARKGAPVDGAEPSPDGPQLHGDAVGAETLWACTACSACADVCPVRIDPVGMILEMRRYLVAEGQLSGTPATALRRMENSSNPWGLPAEQRMDWAEGLEVPTVRQRPDFEILYWVGCAAAYDRRVRRVARAFVRLLNAAGVRFAVLGTEERCTGDSARRIGEEFIFQGLATSNIETLNKYKVRKIVTHCPHCLNALKQDYAQFGAHYEVVHHSQLLADLLRQGRLRFSNGSKPDGSKPGRRLTLHDPCYLARVHQIVAAPREVLQNALFGGDALIEMERSGGNTFCCGAGGGRMWFEEAPTQRVGNLRAAEALATGADTVGVGCPFCMTMMTDSMAQASPDTRVFDIAELLAEKLPEPVSVQQTSQSQTESHRKDQEP